MAYVVASRERLTLAVHTDNWEKRGQSWTRWPSRAREQERPQPEPEPVQRPGPDRQPRPPGRGFGVDR